jgi:uncharacterized membrane protein (DUF4010 family)
MDNLLLDMLLSLILGILIGLERGVRKEGDDYEIVGIRTFGLIGLFGGISTYIGITYNIAFFAVSFFSLSLFLLTLYVMELKIKRGVGATTVMAAFITYILGSLVLLGEKTIAASLAVIVTLLLSLKPRLHYFIKRIAQEELYAILKFLLITVVILPFLPNKAYGPGNFFNPYQVWFFVVLVAGISFIGYVFVKLFGQERGLILTSIFGGIASSTALTLSLARLGKSEGYSNLLTVGILISWFIMFQRILAISLIINIDLIKFLLFPFCILSAVILIFIAVYWFNAKENRLLQTDLILFNNPLQLKTALAFGLILLLIMFLTYIFRIYFGSLGIYAISIISAITDVDAITLTVSSLSKEEISHNVAANAIFLAAIVNTVVKGLFVILMSNKKMKKNILLVLSIFLLTGMFVIIFNEFVNTI